MPVSCTVSSQIRWRKLMKHLVCELAELDTGIHTDLMFLRTWDGCLFIPHLLYISITDWFERRLIFTVLGWNLVYLYIYIISSLIWFLIRLSLLFLCWPTCFCFAVRTASTFSQPISASQESVVFGFVLRELETMFKKLNIFHTYKKLALNTVSSLAN